MLSARGSNNIKPFRRNSANTGCDFHTNKIRALFALCLICLREKPHVSSPAQPQSPTQNQNQWQIQHVKASKSMDLGTTQNQHHTGGDMIFSRCALCMVAACILTYI